MRLVGFLMGVVLALTLTGPAVTADDGAPCANPKQLDGFKTCADSVSLVVPRLYRYEWDAA